MEKAVVYARYSHSSQSEQSIEGQLSQAEEYAKKAGYKIVETYIDRGQSGRTDNRDAFQRMLSDTAKKKFTVIICWKVDRFGRNREEIAVNKMRCKKNGVRVEYVAETIPEGPEGVILESMLEGFAEYFSLQLSQNVRRGQQKSREKGLSIGGICPIGYKVNADKRFVLDPEYAPIVKMIFDQYEEGYTLSEIAKNLTDAGLRNNYDRPFTLGSIHNILKRENYTGVYINLDTRIIGGMPRIIEPEQWQRVQDQMKRNRRAPERVWTRVHYLLTNKLFCGHCGNKMVGETGTSKNGAPHHYYACIGRRKLKTCHKRSIRQDIIEPLVLNAVLQILYDDEIVERIADAVCDYYNAEKEAVDQLSILQKELKSTETKITNLLKVWESGVSSEALNDRIRTLETQKRDLEESIEIAKAAEKLRITKDHVIYYLHQLRQGDINDFDTQLKLIESFINAIYVYDDHIKLSFNFTEKGEAETMSLATANAIGAGKTDVRSFTLTERQNSYARTLLVLGGMFCVKINTPDRR